MIERENRQILEPHSAVGKWLGAAVGVVLLGSVLIGYSVSLRIGMWPPGHPWSGMTLVALAFVNMSLARLAPDRRGAVLRIAAAGVSMTGAALWLAATLMRASW
jgi:hypothetical protein